MKKLNLQDIKKTSRWILPAGMVVLGAIAIVATDSGTSRSKADTAPQSGQLQAVESPVPTSKPEITINGKEMPTDKEGQAEVDVPGGTAQVNVSGDRTTITTSDSSAGGDTSNNNSETVDVNISSQTHGGTSWGSTQVYGFNSSSNNSGTSFSSTSIFSNETGDVSISQ
jgi:hypothetical protein